MKRSAFRSVLAMLSLLSSTPPQAGSPEALKEVDRLFSDLFCWFGTMYDRHSGGCYRTIASREQPDAYPPHIEHTSKFTKPIQWSGTEDRVPEPMAAALVAFMKEKQIVDPEHRYYGFFLDPNYPRLDPDRDMNIRSASRALGMATGVLELFGETPDAPLPNLEQNPDAYAHLDSGESFKAWIDQLHWERTWSAGGTLATQGELISGLPEARREELLEAAWEHLDTYRDEKTGLWGHLDRGENASTDYIAMNGSYKIARFYWEMGQPIPLADTLKEYALDYFQTHKPDNVLHVYDTIQMINHLQSSLSKPLTEEETAKLFSTAAEYLALFRREDGGFSRQHRGGWGAGAFQPEVKQPTSDTDSSGLALKTRNAMYEIVHGEGNAPPLPYAKDDRMFALSGAIGKKLFLVPADNEGAENDVRFALEYGQELFFVGLKGNTGKKKNGTVVVSYSTDKGKTFQEAGRTTLPGVDQEPASRDIPLSTIWELQKSKEDALLFRIKPANGQDQLNIERVEVWGR